MRLSERAQKAIHHARRTTGTLQWCGVGVFSGDGRYSLESNSCRYETPESVREYVNTRCTMFTRDEMIRANVNCLRRLERYKRLAIAAIQVGKFSSACILLELAENQMRKSREIVDGKCLFYRLKG